MTILQSWLGDDLFRFFLVFARLGSALIFLPGVGEAFIPPRIRLALALWLSFAFVPVLGSQLPGQPSSLDRLLWLLLHEIMIGIYFGLLARLFLLGLQFSGMFMATQMGIATSLVQDPISAQQSAALSNLLSLSALCVIMATDISQLLFKGLLATYQIFPTHAPLPLGDMAEHFTKIVSQSLVLALQIAAPFFIYGILLFLGLGVLSRLMPQLQVFFIAIPLQVLGGLAMLSFTLSAALMLFAARYAEFLRAFL